MFFTTGNGLWISDGTPAGTYAVVPDVGGNVFSRAVAGGYFYFDTSGTGGTKLWKSDGSFDGTTGTKLRWPGAVNVNTDSPVTSFDRPAGFSIFTAGTAPYTGEKATGVVTISANGPELGRVTLAPETAAQRLLATSSSAQRLPVYLPALGVNALRLDYSGDANFLPMTSTYNVTATTGLATILGGAVRNGTTAKVDIRVTGSPESTPTGTIRISEAGVIAPIDIPLTTATGTAPCGAEIV
jgi:hypothetical protein